MVRLEPELVKRWQKLVPSGARSLVLRRNLQIYLDQGAATYGIGAVIEPLGLKNGLAVLMAHQGTTLVEVVRQQVKEIVKELEGGANV